MEAGNQPCVAGDSCRMHTLRGCPGMGRSMVSVDAPGEQIPRGSRTGVVPEFLHPGLGGEADLLRRTPVGVHDHLHYLRRRGAHILVHGGTTMCQSGK